MKLSDAQAMLTRLQELAGEWAEKGTIWTENIGDSDWSQAGSIGLLWGNPDQHTDDSPGVWIAIANAMPDSRSYLTTWENGADTSHVVNPTPAQVDEAVRSVLEGDRKCL